MSESAELVKRLRAEAARNEAGIKVFDGVPDVDQASDTMQCAADDLRAAADAIEKLEAERNEAIRGAAAERRTLGRALANKAWADAEARVKVLEEALRAARAAYVEKDDAEALEAMITIINSALTPAPSPHQPPAPPPHDAAGDS